MNPQLFHVAVLLIEHSSVDLQAISLAVGWFLKVLLKDCADWRRKRMRRFRPNHLRCRSWQPQGFPHESASHGTSIARGRRKTNGTAVARLHSRPTQRMHLVKRAAAGIAKWGRVKEGAVLLRVSMWPQAGMRSVSHSEKYRRRRLVSRRFRRKC